MFATLVAVLVAGAPAVAQTPPAETLFRNVRVFDGTGAPLSPPTDVLVRGNVIASIGAATAAPGATVIDGGGRTLMPGLIDAHTHIMFSTLPQAALLTADIGFVSIAAAKAAQDMLMRGFTSARDLGGPVFGLKQAIDAGLATGPRIWPSGAFISQTGGHGDFRLPNELPAAPGSFGYADRIGAAAIADDATMVRTRAREQLALGATQIKLMAGGGVSSAYDPLDVTQYTEGELRAGVEAAENWGTYATVHAYTPRAVRQALAAGVKCIDHGNMLDDATAKLMADKGVWWSLQPFTDDGSDSRFAEGSPSRIKQLTMYAGTDTAYALARKYRIKTAWGTDILFSAAAARGQGQLLAKMVKWYSPTEALTIATSGNAALLALSGPRNPYPGRLGVVAAGALADLILVDGDPTRHLALVADADKNFVVIMKDGKVYKNTVSR
ncbi:amidohydrolase family protein [Sandarakinorhabdus sp. DWP1-3-1]|uniref:metal-dependent hydrolase family protein n=1 Tax=Sandarakinorhabdus sp. DWP1-3-1 TaxID=2804627 RepID=UPI003CFADEEB